MKFITLFGYVLSFINLELRQFFDLKSSSKPTKNLLMDHLFYNKATLRDVFQLGHSLNNNIMIM